MKPEQNHIQVYSEIQSRRLKFAVDFFFSRVGNFKVHLVLNEVDINPDLPTISYSHRPVHENTFHIRPAAILKEKTIEEQNIQLAEWGKLPCFFATEGSDIPFDVLGAAFYLVSRYEEYLPAEKDEHDRFLPRQSLAARMGFLERPLIDEWFKKLQTELYTRFGVVSKRRFKFVNTIDVDSAFAFVEKGLFRTVGAALRDLTRGKFTDVKHRVATILLGKKDPFNTFKYALDVNKKYGFDSIFFFLLGDYGTYDKNVPYTGMKFRALMKRVNDYATVGIHPSYYANNSSSMIGEQIERLSNTVHMPVEHSRFHFLKSEVPHSYRALINADILHDYTMGYASKPGFRASTCTPFKFFDLVQNRATRLTIHPFCLMEGTLKNYANTTPEAAFEKFKQFTDIVHSVQGTLYFVWHNDSLSNHGSNKGWREVYEKTIDYVGSKSGV